MKMLDRGDYTQLRLRPRSGLPAALLCGVLSFCCCLLRAGEPVISEFLASNSHTLLDADDEATDWIEIHNPGPGVTRLDGWHLSDDPDDLTRWTFPAETVLEAGQYLVVFASGKNRLSATENFSYRASSTFAHALDAR
jgi:hypothetical protein